VSVLLIDDQETVVRALEVARAILGECIAGQRDAAKTVERLVSALNKSEVIQALDRMTGVESCDGLILEMGHRCSGCSPYRLYSGPITFCSCSLSSSWELGLSGYPRGLGSDFGG
jgi:hypothetical protein